MRPDPSFMLDRANTGVPGAIDTRLGDGAETEPAGESLCRVGVPCGTGSILYALDFTLVA